MRWPLPTVLLAVCLACGRSGPVRFAEPVVLEVLLGAAPAVIDNAGQRTTLTVQASRSDGAPAVGTVRLSATAGRLATEDVTLAAGQATTTFTCDVAQDARCRSAALLAARWETRDGLAVASTTVLLREQSLDGGRALSDTPEVDAGVGPLPRRCAEPADTECAGPVDEQLTALGVPASRLNGTSGNGFDDDCDGLADEGCSCASAGLTKACTLVPATQLSPSTGQPVGWCAANAKGTVDCSGDRRLSWSGVCRGAQAPAQTDSCDLGDFDCDGLQRNSRCACRTLAMRCPTEDLTLAPYPDPMNLPLVDGREWIADQALRARTRNWLWTVVGGDCDSVLPHPTFAMFRTRQAQPSARTGLRYAVELDRFSSPPRYVPQSSSGLMALIAATGDGLDGAFISPAFALSGDYVVQGQFEFEGQIYSCSQRVKVRAPGVRVELCWQIDREGLDVDLHFARLQGTTCTTHGWGDVCRSGACDYRQTSPIWGYAPSDTRACTGWAARGLTRPDGGCNNPRLDRDQISCDPLERDPTASDFCGPENINLDNPRDGERFVVGVNYFGGEREVPVHANVYCNGERVVSMGFNPVTGSGFPRLLRAGGDSSGDFWTAAVLTTRVDSTQQLTSCFVETIPSRTADPLRDGSQAYCVDTGTSRAFVAVDAGQGDTPGSIPTARERWCKH